MNRKDIKKVIVLDMDGVIFREKNFWIKMHELLSTKDIGTNLTIKHLRNNYQKLVRKVLKLWRGKTAGPYLSYVKKARYTRGTKEALRILKKRGYYIIVVSSGSSHLLKRALDELPIDEGYANELVIRNGKIAGEFKQNIKNNGKLVILRALCKRLKVPLTKIVAVGDSENDIPLFKNVGFSIAFCPASEKTAREAKKVVRRANLKSILKFTL